MKIYDKITDFFGNFLKNAHVNRPKESDRPTIIPNKGYVDEFDTLRTSEFAEPDEKNKLDVSTTTIGGLDIGSKVAGMKSRDLLEKILYGFKNNSQSRYVQPSIKLCERIDDELLPQGIDSTIKVRFEFDKGSCPGIKDIYYTAGRRATVHPYSGSFPVTMDELTIQVTPSTDLEDLEFVIEFLPITIPLKDNYGNDIAIPENLEKVAICSKNVKYSSTAPVLSIQGALNSINIDAYNQNVLNALVTTGVFKYDVDENWTKSGVLGRARFMLEYINTPQEVYFLVPAELISPFYTLALNDSTDISSALQNLGKLLSLSLGNGVTKQYTVFKFVSGAIPFEKQQLLTIGRFLQK